MSERKTSNSTPPSDAEADSPADDTANAPSAGALPDEHHATGDKSSPEVPHEQPDLSITERDSDDRPEIQPGESDDSVDAGSLATCLAELASSVKEIGKRFDAIAQQSGRVHEINGKLHAELQTLRGSEVLAMMRPGFGGFVRLIGLIDSDIARSQESDDALVDKLQGYRIDLANALQDCGLIEEPPTSLEEPTRFSPGNQEVNVIVPTDDPDLNQTIVRIARPAFSFEGRQLFRERVDVYRYTAPKAEKEDQ